MSGYSKLRGLVREIGWADAGLHLVNRAGAVLGREVRAARYVLVAQPVSSSPLVPPNRGRAIETRPVQDRHALEGAPHLPPELVARRFAAGSICLGAFERGRLVGYAWLTIGPHDDEILALRFVPSTPGIAWDYDFYVEPTHRLGFVFAKLWDAVFTELRARGVAWSFSYVASYNKLSLRSQLRMGAIPVGRFVAIGLARRQLLLQLRPLRLALTGGAGPRVQIPLRAPP